MPLDNQKISRIKRLHSRAYPLQHRTDPRENKYLKIVRMHGGANLRNNPSLASQQNTTGDLAKPWATLHRTVSCFLLCLLSHPLWAQGSGRFYGVVTDLGRFCGCFRKGRAAKHGNRNRS